MGSNAATLRYDESGRLAEIAASDGGSIKFRHHASGRMVEAQASDGSWARYGYADIPLPTGPTAVWTFAYNGAGRLAVLNGAAAGETRFAYDATGRVTSRSWAGGFAERFDYDDAKRSIRHTDTEGRVTAPQWSADRRQLTMTDASGAKAVHEFDASGALVAITGEKGRATFAYDTQARLAEITGPDGGVQRIAYLGATKLPASITGPQGKRELSYDAQHNITAFDDGSARAEFAYDKDGRLISSKMQGGEAWQYEFDEKGRRKSATDAQGRAVQFRYDEAGHLAGETFSDGTSLGYEYGVNGRLTAITSADGARRTFSYDAAGQVSHVDSTTGNPQALQARLDHLAGARGTAPGPTVPRPFSFAAKTSGLTGFPDISANTTVATPVAPINPTVPTPITPQNPTVPTPASPPIAPTVATPVPPPSFGAQILRGAQIGTWAAGALMTVANVYAAVEEGQSAALIVGQGVLGAAVSYGVGAAIGTVASPLVLGGLAAGGLAWGAYATAGRVGDTLSIRAVREAAAYANNQAALMPILGGLAELRGLRAEITTLRTAANNAGTEGQAALAAARAAVTALPPNAPPLTEARVSVFLAAASTGDANKAATGAGATKAEGGAASVAQKLTVVDGVVCAANPPDADIQNALTLFSEVQALVTAVVKDANDVTSIATALKAAANDARSVPAQRAAARALFPVAEVKMNTCADYMRIVRTSLTPATQKLARFTELAHELSVAAEVAANQITGAPPETMALFARRVQEINEAVRWTPAPEVAAASGFAQAAPERMDALQAKLDQSRTFLFKIPDATAIPNADAEAARAAAAAAAAQARMEASAGAYAKLRAMGGTVDVPSVVKLKAADAKAKLTAAGFTNIALAASGRAPGAGDEPFTVEQQSPAGGTKARRTVAVTLTVLGGKADASNNLPASPGKLRIPDGLAGLTENEAKARLMAAGFTSIGIVSANDPKPDSKAGTVEQHVPLAGEVERGTTVTLYIFPKPGEAIVPGVHGLTVREAKLQIEGVKLKTALQVSGDQPADKEHEFTVQSQSHAKGEKLPQGETVTLSIYPKFSSPSSDTMPNVVGLSMDEALAKIRSAGLKPGAVTTVALPKDKQDQADTVVSHVPIAGQPFPADKLVSIVAYAQRARAGGTDPAPMIPEGPVPGLVGKPARREH